MISFDYLEQIAIAAAEGVRPPERLTVSEAAAKYRFLRNTGAYVGPWLNETTPYLVEPMDVLGSEEFTGMVFAGPAQCGKTDMALNWVNHTVVCDPMDMMIVEAAQHRARDFSMRRIDRLHEHTDAVRHRVMPGRNNDNTFDKHYTSGMILTLAWPTKNHLSGKPIPRIWFSDYDRMDQDVETEGAPFDLGQKRTTTFRSFGMTVAESSPSFPVTNPKWQKKTNHEAPPTEGILALYNRGDRRRYYWKCVECGNPFEPDFSLMRWPQSTDRLDAAEQAHLCCPHCDAKYYQEETDLPGKHEMNRSGRWIKDGQVWRPDGQIVGDALRSDIASFWLKGVCATFADFKTLVTKQLAAEEEYENNGSEEALKTTANTDQGVPYVPKSQASLRAPEDIQSRAIDLPIRTVPPGVRFLIAAIDLQKNRFEVQVMGYGPTTNGQPDCWVIDRFKIQKSKRTDEDGDPLWVNLGVYPEDWKQLVDEVLLKKYPLSDGSGRTMGIKMTVSDSAGREGFTANAYNFVRWLRLGPQDTDTGVEDRTYRWEPGLAARFHLLRGATQKTAPRVQVTYPDSERKDRNAGARGEIPVLAINGNIIKDSIDKAIDRTEPGGRIIFPAWLDDNFFKELTVEVKDPQKGWINPNKYRNESWDLLVYARAATLMSQIGLERMNWSDPPTWAADWDENSLVFGENIGDKTQQPAKKRPSLADLASDLA